MRHLLSIADLDRPAIERILDRAKSFTEVSEREVKKVPALRGRRVLNLFYEASTRTRSSFELAAKSLSADVINFSASGSSVEKGESLKDTVQTLSAYRPDLVVIRTPHVGAPALVARWTDAGVVNAGDGKHEHPTQALLDVYTLRRRLGSIEGASIWIVGDVAHSRVARSNIHALTTLGARVRVGGPPAWVAGFEDWPAVEIATTLPATLGGADAVMTLRVQSERGAVAGVGSMAEYIRDWRLDDERMGLAAMGAPILHPGPTNEGVELTAALATGTRSLIGRQVEHGVTVRMAVLALAAGVA